MGRAREDRTPLSPLSYEEKSRRSVSCVLIPTLVFLGPLDGERSFQFGIRSGHQILGVSRGGPHDLGADLSAGGIENRDDISRLVIA